MTEQTDTSVKKRRGLSFATIETIKIMFEIAEECQPITGRGVGYKLFSRQLIPSMKPAPMQKVYRKLLQAREQDIIPWEWIVDETRSLEKRAAWDGPRHFLECARVSYRREFWNQQPIDLEVWSEKGTVRGVLAPVLQKYGVGFRVLHGFTSATSLQDVLQRVVDKPLHVLYVGDIDPSGMFMSEVDIPGRLERYNDEGAEIEFKRIALLPDQVRGLISFPASDKSKDSRFKWFTQNYGSNCWELDALDPNTLRGIVEDEIRNRIYDEEAWERCEQVNRAEQRSLADYLDKWTMRPEPKPRPPVNRPKARLQRLSDTSIKKVGGRR